MSAQDHTRFQPHWSLRAYPRLQRVVPSSPFLVILMVRTASEALAAASQAHSSTPGHPEGPRG